MKIDVNIPRLKCKKCGGVLNYAELKKHRYGIYCDMCNSFIKWADHCETIVIKSRERWIKNHD